MILYDIFTVFWRDWVVLDRRIGKFLISRMVSPILYLVAFGWGLGRNIQMDGASYLDFIVPGIIALNAMNISFNSVATPLNMMRLYQKSFEEYLIAPINPTAFVIGKILSGMFRGLISCAIIFIFTYIFGANIKVSLAFLTTLSLICILFSAMGFVAAMLINSHEDMANFSTYFLLPMSFLCATFFSLETMPAIIRTTIEIMPLTHAVYALRSLGAGGEIPWISMTVLSVYSVALIIWGVWTMNHVRD